MLCPKCQTKPQPLPQEEGFPVLYKCGCGWVALEDAWEGIDSMDEQVMREMASRRKKKKIHITLSEGESHSEGAEDHAACMVSLEDGDTIYYLHGEREAFLTLSEAIDEALRSLQDYDAGFNGENRIIARGPTQAHAWWNALRDAQLLGMLGRAFY